MSWKWELVNSLFNECDKGLIAQIPMLSRRQEDGWQWVHKRKGLYSVKSAYQFLTRHLHGHEQVFVVELWRKLWSLKIPPKVRNLVLHICNHCIPTKLELQPRQIDIELVCALCRAEAESLEHVFLFCPFARDLWASCISTLLPVFVQLTLHWLCQVFSTLSVEDCQMCCMVLWMLWMN
ncbi:hypothetical protein P3X46_000382 [Hevea brasiliensis]|uniref:Reverse transcriptase zinc-binding domain-containing protein n=1 Tax=Hevea brasiliensis TaxID=3981 RepID=A0ABQ9N9T7_HEVBR|nr:hypothetical protein P3X46_000382 [Hevea brasiliensis]